MKILEAISSKVFHFTKLSSALSILNNSEFKLGTSMLNRENDLSNHHNYYLSTSRSKFGTYHTDEKQIRFSNIYSGVMFNLNGNYYNNTHKGFPISFYSPERRKTDPSINEFEDRIVSDKPTLSIGGIEEIHMIKCW